LGTFLRSFTFGHVRQLDAVASRALAGLAVAVPRLLAGATDPDGIAFVDVDDTIREVHGYVEGVISRSQAAGGFVRDRDPSAEAWVFISIGLLGTIDRRLSMLDGELGRIVAARRIWMTGRPA
jgi:hypothetical protein